MRAAQGWVGIEAAQGGYVRRAAQGGLGRLGSARRCEQGGQRKEVWTGREAQEGTGKDGHPKAKRCMTGQRIQVTEMRGKVGQWIVGQGKKHCNSN